MTNDHSPGLTLFFQQAAKRPLLTAREEVVLAQRIEQGDKAAREDLVMHNIRLAINIAKRYRHRNLPFEDLVQEGIIGLHKAVDKFDWHKGYRFSTYATWWIQHYVQRAVQNQSATIRTPGHITARRAKIQRALAENPDATIEELAERGDCRVDQVESALDTSRVVASLDTMLDEDDGSAYSLLPDPDAVQPDEIATKDPRIRDALSKLSELQRQVVELRFGFGGPVRSRDDVAAILAVAPHVVQDAQRKAFVELKRILGDTIDLRRTMRPTTHRGVPVHDLTSVCSRTEPVAPPN